MIGKYAVAEVVVPFTLSDLDFGGFFGGNVTAAQVMVRCWSHAGEFMERLEGGIEERDDNSQEFVR